MELDYGLPTTQVGAMLSFPIETYANQPENVQAEQINTLGSPTNLINVTGSPN